MHTQAEGDRRVRRHPVPALSAATGVCLYLLTLAGEVVLGVSTRWLLAYLGALALGAIVPLGSDAGQLAWLAALLPLGWSVLGLAFPGRGFLWTRKVGTRCPSTSETIIIEDAWRMLRGVDSGLPQATRVCVLDDPLPWAAARGRTVVLSRGLLESDAVPAVLAHELGHTRSLDGRLTEALERLEPWGDPLAPIEPRTGAGARAARAPDRGGLVLGCARWALRLAGGGCAERLLSPLWCAYWRRREYAADAHAASLGQAEDLARHLSDMELPFDAPHRRLLLNRAEHPPVALRIERLQAAPPA
jgi:Zn-dependent protease with chaperone function